MYLSVFLRTVATASLVVLVAAQAYDWNDETIVPNATLVAWGLLGAVIAGALAVLHAVLAAPATTPAGKALRQSVQTFLGLPIAGVVIDSVSDVRGLDEFLIPTVVAVVLAFIVTYLSNRVPAPTGGTTPAGVDAIRGG
jgi:hypothetical protein